ncbi:MAG: peroxiredoxin [Gammaproteobacteria bacterium RIFCSPHIGHO2_12_FULL_38_14]|nr:MAG: peroxiredoxin [Gammaproteobacteria bacterium RIFCSPHIGHO2_12_FULL_38_14]
MKIGDKVSFKGKTKEGELSSNTLLGKNVVIYFYPKDNTPGCTMESKGFRDHYEEFLKNNTEIIGVSRDSIKSHCNFIDKHKLNFPLISDDDGALCKLFGVLKEKSMMGKKYIGIDRSTFLVDSNGILHQEWRDVSVLGHVKAVLTAVSSLSKDRA